MYVCVHLCVVSVCVYLCSVCVYLCVVSAVKGYVALPRRPPPPMAEEGSSASVAFFDWQWFEFEWQCLSLSGSVLSSSVHTFEDIRECVCACVRVCARVHVCVCLCVRA